MEEEAVSSTVSNGTGAGGEDGQGAGPWRGLHRALGETHTGAPWLSTFSSPAPCGSLLPWVKCALQGGKRARTRMWN